MSPRDTDDSRVTEARTMESDCGPVDAPPSAEQIETAAYKHVERMVAKADQFTGGAPLWFGWALRESFQAGANWRARQ